MFQVYVCGIPAQADVVYWEELNSGMIFPEELELYDRKGYRAKWLENKMEDTKGEIDEVRQQIMDYKDDPY